MTIIRNGIIVLPDRLVSGKSLIIENDKIVAIVDDQDLVLTQSENIIDAQNSFVTPGFIDIHSDYIEHMAAPRSTSVMDLELAIYEFEKECMVHGITTMYHSLSLWEGGKALRQTHYVIELADIIDRSHSQLHLIHHRFHLRYEIENLNQVDLMMQLIEAKKVHLLSFMDHTPGQGQYRNLDVYRRYMKKSSSMDESMMEAHIQQRMNAPKLNSATIEKAILAAHERNIAVASHDDDTIEKIAYNDSLNITISEFPITLDVAFEAKRRGMFTVVGAPNVILGGSHSGNLSAEEAIKNKVADVLCSDYYPAALLHSVFDIVDKGGSMVDMINMLTLNPAKAVKIDNITGSISEGKKADLLIIKKLPNGFPAITHVFVDGVCTMQNHYRV